MSTLQFLPGSLRVGPSTASKGMTANSAQPQDPQAMPMDLPVGQSPATTRPSPSADKPYLARLVLLVPAEVISLYVALKPVAEKFLPQFGVACLLLVLLVRMKATSSEDGKPEWGSVAISTISFALWMYSVGGSLPWPPAPADPGVIAVAIALWTFAVPYFYQGSKSTAS